MIHIINHQLLGDSLMATPALKKMYDLGIEYTVYFLDEPIMNIYRHCSWMHNKKWGEMPDVKPGDRVIKLEAGEALNYAMSTGQHYAYGFAMQLGVSIASPRPCCDFDNWPDQYSFNSNNLIHTLNLIGISRQPVLLIFPESSSCSSRSGKKANKMLPWATWSAFYERNKHVYRIFFVTPANLPALIDLPNLWGYDIQEIAFLLRAAHKVLTVDNGIGHLSSAVLANCYLMGGCVPIPWIWADEMSKTLNCHGNPELITVEHIEKLLNSHDKL